MSDDDIYFNAYLQNIYDSTSNTSPGAVAGLFTFNSPLIKNISDYQVAVASLSVPDAYIPLMWWPLDPVTNLDTLFSVYVQNSAQYTANTYSTVNATYVDIAGGGLANRPVLKVDQFTQSINTAIDAAWVASGFVTGTGPQLFFRDGLFQLFYPLPTTRVGGVLVPRLGFNDALNSLITYTMPTTLDFVSLPTSSIAWINFDTLTNQTYRTGSTIQHLITTGSGTQSYGVIPQAFATTNAWTKLTAIRVVMQQCPVRLEQAVATLSNYITNASGSQSLIGRSILIDILATADFSGRQVYFPSILSYHNFDGHGDLQKFAIQIILLDQNNREYPLPIPDGTMVTLKLRFTKRGLVAETQHFISNKRGRS